MTAGEGSQALRETLCGVTHDKHGLPLGAPSDVHREAQIAYVLITEPVDTSRKSARTLLECCGCPCGQAKERGALLRCASDGWRRCLLEHHTRVRSTHG